MGHAGVPPGALPRPHGECTREAGGLCLPTDVRALPGALQDALQADLAPLERTHEVRVTLPVWNTGRV